MTMITIKGLDMVWYLICLQYDLSKFCPYNTVLIDHSDPSINTGMLNGMLLIQNWVNEVFGFSHSPIKCLIILFYYFAITMQYWRHQLKNLVLLCSILSFFLPDGWLQSIRSGLHIIIAIVWVNLWASFMVDMRLFSKSDFNYLSHRDVYVICGGQSNFLIFGNWILAENGM